MGDAWIRSWARNRSFAPPLIQPGSFAFGEYLFPSLRCHAGLHPCQGTRETSGIQGQCVRKGVRPDGIALNSPDA